MKRNNLLTFVFIIIVLLITILALAGCGSSTGSATSESRASGANLETAAKNEIIIKNNAFDPFVLAAKVGDTITWVNEDAYDHQVKATNGEFDSGALAKGAKFSFTFTKEGKCEYYCTIHTFMTGSINVFK
jgi:plastocyanin